MASQTARLAVFFAANVLFGAGLFFHAFLYNFYLEGLGHSTAVMGWAAAALTAGGLLALLPAGRFVDRWGSARTYLFASGTACTGLLLGALVESPASIYLAALLAGFGTVTWRVVSGPIVMLLASGSVRSRAFSWNVALLVGSGAVWMAAAGRLAGWLEQDPEIGRVVAMRLALALGAVGTGLAAACVLPLRGALQPVTPPAGPRNGSGIAASGDPVPRGIRIAVGFVALWMLAPALVLPFFNIYFQRNLGLAVDQIGVVFAASHAVTALVIVGSGELGARFGVRPALAAWTFLFAPVVWLLAGVQGVGFAIVLYFLQGLIAPATNPLIDQLLLEHAPPERRGIVSSWRNAATETAGIIGAGVGGVLLDRSSFGTLFLVAGSLGLVGAMTLVWAVRRFSRR